MNVPKLRFKEFTDEWNIVDLSKTFNYFSTNSLSREQLADSGIIKNIHYGDIHKKYGYVVDIEKRVSSYIKDLNYNNKYEKCQSNDLIFADASEDYDGIGKAIEIINVNESIVSGLHTILARDNSKSFSPMFKGYYFNSPIIHNQIRVQANGFKVFGISKETINNLNAKIPSKEEQTKIADFLSLLDKKIELQTKKIEDLKLYKLSLLNHLLKKYDTKKIILKDICKIYAGGTPSTSNEKYWDGNIKWIQSGLIQNSLIKHDDIKNAITELGLNNSSTKMIKPNTTLLAMTGATCGNTAFLECEACANQSVMAFETTKVNSKFIYYLFQNNKKYILKFQAGGAQSGINKSSCENLEFDFPNIELQNKIVKILNYCEEQLSNNILKLSKLQKLKKGLMQKMFV